MFKSSISLKSKIKVASSLLVVIIVSCQQVKEPTKEKVIVDLNPAAEGFNFQESDSAAIKWADATMIAMGGRDIWDATRYISWNFFGRRDLLWDKYTGNVRIESPGDSMIYLVNINDETGKIQYKGREINDADSSANFLARAKRIWINDSYWLIMPFKLKDSGVTLKYLGEGETENGEEAYILELTFKDVGVTPNNKYEVFITKQDSLVMQWAFYSSIELDSASATWPWDNYKEYNGLMLSADRSDDKGPHDVKIYETVSPEAFTSFDWNTE